MPQNSGRYWAGVLVTAIVAGLAALVGVLLIKQVGKIDLLDPWPWTSFNVGYPVDAVVVTVVFAGLLYLLVRTTPSPRMFFGWILFLATAAVALVMLTQTVSWETRIASAGLVAFIAIVIGVSLTSVSARTIEVPVSVISPMQAQPVPPQMQPPPMQPPPMRPPPTQPPPYRSYE